MIGGATLRSAGAIATGFVLIGALSFTADAVYRALFPGAFDAGGNAVGTLPLLVSQLYVAVFAIAGCYLAALLAGRRPMFHALVLGALGLAFNIVMAVQFWGTAPAWYFMVALALVMPYAWIGGRLREAQVGPATPALAPADVPWGG